MDKLMKWTHSHTNLSIGAYGEREATNVPVQDSLRGFSRVAMMQSAEEGNRADGTVFGRFASAGERCVAVEPLG